MKQVQVTVIVPVYNGERFLRAALESLFAQQFDAFECLLIDDASEDCSGAIAQEFPVRYYRNKQNVGQAASRNLGIALSRGEYVAFLDADDVLPPTKLGVQAAFLSSHPEIGCVLGRQEIMLEGIEAPAWLKRDQIYGDLDGIPLVSAMFRKDVLDRLGGFDPTYRFGEDRDLFVRMREHGIAYHVLDDLLLYRRFHGENINFHRPDKPPVLRSLKEKLDRERVRGQAEA